MLMPGEENYASDNFGLYKNDKSIPKVQDIKRDYKDLLDESTNIKSRTKGGSTLQNVLLGNKL